ncbi:MAG TPA: hypothetical protein VEP66_04360 [Myxococcales bacterium]|nr:hypothetical protein [Myxococcales bacterium]
MGTALTRENFFKQAAVAVLVCGLAGAASAQQTPPSTTGDKPPETAQAAPPPSSSPVPTFAVLGPSREIKLGENTWFRFGAQVQAWWKASQDRLVQPDGGDGGYAMDFYCRRCRFFATGSVVRNVFFNVLFEAGNFGRVDPAPSPNQATGTKTNGTPQILDAYGQVKFVDAFWISGGSILMPLTRNGLQPTTTYVSIDTSNVAATPVAQVNSFVLRDLGFQANGFFLANHLEYRAGVFQGSRQPPPVAQSASHNAPRFVGMLSYNLWDTETGYVNGGHYYGARRVLGVMVNGDYQILRKAGPGLPAPGSGANQVAAIGKDKNAYWGVSGAIFLNYPINGPNPKGGDEIVGLLQFGYYDGGFRQNTAAPSAITNAGTYPNVLQQNNYLAEAGYYNHNGHFSIFGKFEKRKIRDYYPNPLRIAQNQTWIAGGVKYYIAPFNFMNFALQYERIMNNDADLLAAAHQDGTNNITFQMQTLLY